MFYHAPIIAIGTRIEFIPKGAQYGGSSETKVLYPIKIKGKEDEYYRIITAVFLDKNVKTTIFLFIWRNNFYYT